MPCDWMKTPVAAPWTRLPISRTGLFPLKLLPTSHSNPRFAPSTSLPSYTTLVVALEWLVTRNARCILSSGLFPAARFWKVLFAMEMLLVWAWH